MARPKSSQPTEREYSILQVLWQHGSSTVREVHTILEQKETIAYTTVLTTLQVMTEKGLVHKDSSQRSHIFSAAYSQDSTQQGMVGHWMQRFFQGNAVALMSKALSAKPASAEELEQMQQLIQQWQEQHALKIDKGVIKLQE